MPIHKDDNYKLSDVEYYFTERCSFILSRKALYNNVLIMVLYYISHNE